MQSSKFPPPGFFCPDFDPAFCARRHATELVAKHCGRHGRRCIFVSLLTLVCGRILTQAAFSYEI